MKPITFAPQAPFKITTRKLELAWVRQTIAAPDWTEPDPRDTTVERRFAVIRQNGDRVLRVAVRETASEFHVISAFFDRGARKRHAAQQLRP